jgi:Spy/CpxP family protein refolding chaperone
VKARTTAIVLLALSLSAAATPALAQRRKAAAPAKVERVSDLEKKRKEAVKDLEAKTETYKASLRSLIEILERTRADRAAEVAKRRELFNVGIARRLDVEESERELADVTARIDDAKSQIVEADEAVAEAKVPPAYSSPGRGYTTSGAVIRGYGGGWSIAEVAKVQSFFAGRFGRALPISAFGQSAVHDRLGFDHRNAVDVGVHPDSSEGQALMAYLRSAGIPFLAFRQEIPGKATGAHIHIGFPSHRLFR